MFLKSSKQFHKLGHYLPSFMLSKSEPGKKIKFQREREKCMVSPKVIYLRVLSHASLEPHTFINRPKNLTFLLTHNIGEEKEQKENPNYQSLLLHPDIFHHQIMSSSTVLNSCEITQFYHLCTPNGFKTHFRNKSDKIGKSRLEQQRINNMNGKWTCMSLHNIYIYITIVAYQRPYFPNNFHACLMFLHPN